MALLSRLRGLLGSVKAKPLVDNICAEAVERQGGRYERVKLAGLPSWEALKAAPAATQIAAAMSAMDDLEQGMLRPTTQCWLAGAARKAVASQLMQRNLPFSEAQLVHLVQRWATQRYSLENGLPGLSILGAVERHCVSRSPSDAMREALRTLRHRALHQGLGDSSRPTSHGAAIAARVDALLGPPTAAGFDLPQGGFATTLRAWLDALPAQERISWQDLVAHAMLAADRARPSAKWLSEGAELTASFGKEAATARMIALLDAVTPEPTELDRSLDLLRAMIWLTATLDGATIAAPLGRFVEKCFKKVTGVGARSVKLGNAGLLALAQMTGEPAAAAELFRLRTRLKQPSARKVLEKCLSDYAEKTSRSVAALEDETLPTFGLDTQGQVRARFGPATGVIMVNADEVRLDWLSDDRPLKSVPTAAARDHGTEVAAFKRLARDIEAARATQAVRLEQSWLEGRTWTYRRWRENVLDHPLRRHLAQALIWRIAADGLETDVMPVSGGLETLSQGLVQPPDDAIVRLWHPLDSRPEEVLGWRERIIEREITQPFKQAHREIYVLTDAERRTGTYSNRFAAHILRQHQFKALCAARGWQYQLMGAWDNRNTPHRALPHHGLLVEYHVTPIQDGGQSDALVPLHVTTDQLRFVAPDGSALPLESIAPIVFSECLRDVDLFVAVTSIANDPNWSDGGPDGVHADYWGLWAFGDLTPSAQTRRALIARIAPKLAIADLLEVTEKFLIVQGRRQKYAIHFGSGNIQILPSNRYLCIVANPEKQGSRKLKLPFTGDTMLSIILSKAFLLTDESKIKDRRILAQL